MTRPPAVFDRSLVKKRLARRDGAPDFVTTLVIEDLRQRLSAVSRSFSRALVLGPDARRLPHEARSATAPIAFTRVSTLVPEPGLAAADPENLALAGRHDLIVSLFDLQIVNDVPGFLTRLHAHLVPDGLVLAAAIGGRSLTELRESWLAADAEMAGGAAPRVAPMIDVRDAGALLQRAGFALPVADLETHIVRYSDPLALMRELKALGASNPLAARAGALTTPARLLRAAEIYAGRFSDPDGRIRASLDILWLSGWSPHDSQQKPLRPGSAQKSLRDVLGDES